MQMHTPARSFFTLCAAAGLVLGTVALTRSTIATPAPAPAPVSVAVVDLQRLINSLVELADRNKELDIIGADFNAKIDELTVRAKAIEAELKDVIPKDNRQARAAKNAELIELQTQLDARKRVSTSLFDLRRADVIRELYAKASKNVADFAARDGYDIILLDDRSISISETGSMNSLMQQILAKRVLHAASTIDLTDRMITQMNNDYAAKSK
jgi:Skp family chaperone for outer membrane proteins